MKKSYIGACLIIAYLLSGCAQNGADDNGTTISFSQQPLHTTHPESETVAKMTAPVPID